MFKPIVKAKTITAIILIFLCWMALFHTCVPAKAEEIEVKRIKCLPGMRVYRNSFKIAGERYRLKAMPMPGFNSKFQNVSGWIGGDAIYSVKLTEDRILWLFGDTLIGRIKDGKRVDTIMINNTVAIQENSDPDKAKLRFYSAGDSRGNHRSIFIPPDEKGFFWIYDGVMIGSRLFLALIQIEVTDEDSAFGFKTAGAWIAVIDNPLENPAGWKPRYKRIPFGKFGTDETTFFGSAFLLKNDKLYIYGVKDEKKENFLFKHAILARVDKDKVLDFEHWRFYNGGGWTEKSEQCKPIAGELANEYTVFYHEGLKRYVMVFTRYGNSDQVAMRLSENPEGDWDKAVQIYKCPESIWGKNVLIYAGKGHKSLGLKENEMIISYATNLLKLDYILKNARFYWPRFVRIEFKTQDPGL